LVGLPLSLSLASSEDKVKIVEHWYHGEGAEEDQDRAKDPEQQRESCIEEPVPHSVENEAFLKDLIDVLWGHQGHGVLRGVD